jgi:hypothetical protein
MRFSKAKFAVSFGILASAALTVPSFGATIRDDEPDSAYLALAALADFTPVGTLVNSWGYTGCGILIAPNWVLTAAHVLTAASSGTFSIDGTAYTSTSLFRDPAWNGNAMAGNDFALMELNTPVTNVTPAAFYAGTSEFGLIGTYVGYGFTGTGLTGWKTLDGQKRAFQNVIDSNFNNPAQIFGSLFINPHDPAAGNALPLEGCVAPGDSGGGVFIQEGSQYLLTGVISFVAATNGSANSYYGNYSGFSRISTALPWIESTVPGLVPEPSVAALMWGTGLLAFVFWRKKNWVNDSDPGRAGQFNDPSREFFRAARNPPTRKATGRPAGVSNFPPRQTAKWRARVSCPARGSRLRPVRR